MSTKDKTREGLRAEVERLRTGINGYLTGETFNPWRPNRNAPCPHGRYRWQGCETCTDEYFSELLK